MMRHLASTSLIAALTASVVGCGTQVTGATQALSLGSTGGRLYTKGGMAQVLVKRVPGSTGAMKVASATLRPMAVSAGMARLGWSMVGVAPSQVSSVVQALRQDRSVLAVQPNLQRNLIKPGTAPGLEAAGLPGFTAAATPNDPHFGKQYAPQLVKAPEAWGFVTGKGQTIAIVDTGVDTGHPDLKDHVVPGWNTVSNNANDKDDFGHGTHCAGIAAGLANNREGIAGIAPDAKIMSVKVLGADGSGSDETVASGITWAADHGATVINLSLGGPGESKVMNDAVDYALRKGAVLVAAMGNDGTNEKSYPAACEGVIAVGASDKQDKIASFSQWGSWISVAAPGVKIFATMPTYKVAMSDWGFPRKYASMDGTSMAAPAAAGVTALVRSWQPKLSAEQVKARLEATADKVPSQNNQPNEYFGHGRVNALRAVQR
ncbi:MAG: S8 family peptidase [Candidatus Sericytochromatia bacterium]|nr:S8 family peptidase [Candidatus Sericytochromatia bacterium]